MFAVNLNANKSRMLLFLVSIGCEPMMLLIGVGVGVLGVESPLFVDVSSNDGSILLSAGDTSGVTRVFDDDLARLFGFTFMFVVNLWMVL